MSGDSLYAALGAPRTASSRELLAAFDRIRSTSLPTSTAYLAAAQAYAILGDPRLRAEYDAGRVVGTGVSNYFEPGLRPLRAESAPPSLGRVRQLEARWHHRVASYAVPPRPARRSPQRVSWPIVFMAGNATGFVLTLVGIRLALGHPIAG